MYSLLDVYAFRPSLMDFLSDNLNILIQLFFL